MYSTLIMYGFGLLLQVYNLLQLKDIALVFSSILSFQACSFQEIHRKKCTHVFEKKGTNVSLFCVSL